MTTKTRTELTQQFLDEYQPQGAVETELVNSLADTAWQLNRIPMLEARLLPSGDGIAMAKAYLKEHRALAALSTLEGRLDRQFYRTLKLLNTMQARRRAAKPVKTPKNNLVFIN